MITTSSWEGDIPQNFALVELVHCWSGMHECFRMLCMYVDHSQPPTLSSLEFCIHSKSRKSSATTHASPRVMISRFFSSHVAARSTSEYSIIGAPFVDIRAKLDSLKNMMPAPSLGAEQCNLIG